jgi:arsenate reductase
MQEGVLNLLFLCHFNAARSIMAEGLMNTLGSGRIRAFSAGVQPAAAVHPLALSTLEAFLVPATGFRAKSWTEFTRADSPRLDLVITLCDRAASEPSPEWPGSPLTAHWGVADPVAFEGSEARKAKLFWDTANLLKRRVELLDALPIASLGHLALQSEVREIGAL